jgi:hypothetical protein
MGITLGSIANPTIIGVNSLISGGVLDSLISQSPAFAASTRKLRAGYFGPSMRVRRSSDNLETDIGFTSTGDLDTIALLAHVGGSSGFVSKYYDQSNNGRDLVQVTLAAQPRIVNAGVIDKMIGGTTKPMIHTDGINQTMATSSFLIPQPFTRSSVFQFLNVSVVSTPVLLNSSVLSGGTDVYLYFNGATGDLRNYAGSASYLIKGGIAVNDIATLVESFNIAGGSTVSYNGANIGVAPGGNSLNGLRIGSIEGASDFSNELYGDLIIFPAALSTSERQLLESNQKAYYGTP